MEYHYLENPEFESRMRRLCGRILQATCHHLKEDHGIGAGFSLVGSGKNKLILQWGNDPVDLDYNLEIRTCPETIDCHLLRACVRQAFCKALREHGLSECKESRSVLSFKYIKFSDSDAPPFGIDLCVIRRNGSGHFDRLIRQETDWGMQYRYTWNEAPHSAGVKEKAERIKAKGAWAQVRDEYRKIKNQYRNDSDHPSFVCCIEAVNHVYHTIRHR